MVNSETASSPYRIIGSSRQNKSPYSQAWCQKVLAASGRLKQQNSKSENDKFIMKTAVAFRV